MSDHGQQHWLVLAFERRVVRRSLIYAVVVGAILILINHGDALSNGDVDGGRWVRMALTLVVPYLVSTLSSVGALRSATLSGRGEND